MDSNKTGLAASGPANKQNNHSRRDEFIAKPSGDDRRSQLESRTGGGDKQGDLQSVSGGDSCKKFLVKKIAGPKNSRTTVNKSRKRQSLFGRQISTNSDSSTQQTSYTWSESREELERNLQRPSSARRLSHLSSATDEDTQNTIATPLGGVKDAQVRDSLVAIQYSGEIVAPRSALGLGGNPETSLRGSQVQTTARNLFQFVSSSLDSVVGLCSNQQAESGLAMDTMKVNCPSVSVAATRADSSLAVEEAARSCNIAAKR